MTLILDPANTADDAGYNGIRTILSLTVTQVSNIALDADPLYQEAEQICVEAVPEASLLMTGTDEGRNYPFRNRIITADQYLSVANMLYGGSNTTTFTSGGGTREVSAVSESIGPVTVRTDYRDFGGTRSGTTTHGVADRSAFFIESAYRILLALNPDFIVPDHHNAIISGGSIPVKAAVTDSAEINFDNILAYLDRYRSYRNP